MHPLQITLLQHDCIGDFCTSSESGNKQMGQSPRWLLSGCRNKISSLNSAARFLHSALCCGLCSRWQVTLQYRIDLQAAHFFSWMSSTSQMPQEAQHHDVVLAVSSRSVLIVLFAQSQPPRHIYRSTAHRSNPSTTTLGDSCT
mmetsp:Transcript_13700/g.20426  ORF Transcript_13700/g.20426 Transcript_13700/m.20426 type:complete len:143 (+) Transcript_13700:194-622(+)